MDAIAIQSQKNPGQSRCIVLGSPRFGAGQAILLNFGLGAAANTAAPETTPAGFLDQVLEASPACRLSKSLRRPVRFDFAAVKATASDCRHLLSEAKVGSVLSAHLPEAALCNESKRASPGTSRQLDCRLQTRRTALSIFPERQAPPELRLQATNCTRGSGSQRGHRFLQQEGYIFWNSKIRPAKRS